MPVNQNDEFEIVEMPKSLAFKSEDEFEIVEDDELIAPSGETVRVSPTESARLIREEGYKTPYGAAAEQETFRQLVEKSPVTKGESALSGALGSLTFGAATPITGIYEGITGGGGLRGIKKSMEAAGLREEIRQAKNPIPYLAGAIGGAMLVPGYSALKAPTIAKGIGTAAAIGAAEGAGTAVLKETTDPFDRTLKERAEQVGQAGALGLIGGTAGGVIAKRPEIREIAVEGIKSIPDVAKATYKAFGRGMQQAEFPGQTAAVAEGLREVARTLSQRRAAKTLLATDKKQYLDEIGSQLASGTEIGKQFAGGKASINDVIKNTVKNYVEAKGVSIVANELAKAAGSEQGIDVFQPIKEDLVTYLVEEKGLTEQQARIVVSVLPSNPIEMVGMIPGSTRMNATDKKISKLPNISDEEYILLRATESGPNKVKDLVTRVSSTLFGGRGSESKVLEEVFNIPLEQRVKARGFEPYEGAEALKPSAIEASEAYQQGAVKQVEELLPKAVSEFESAGPKVYDLYEKFKTARDDADIVANRHPGISKYIDDATEIWEKGLDVSSAGLERGSYDQVNEMQRFMRLQRARETIDDGIPYDQLKLRDANEGEKILLGLRKSVDDVLKASPSKVKSDAIYSEMKNVLKQVFGRAEYKGEIDTGKIEKMLRDTDEAKRFRSHFETLRKWSNDPTFDANDRAKMTSFLDKFDDIYKMASQKQKIGKFEWKEGPTSAAVDRLGNIIKEESLAAELFSSPRTALQKMDEFEKNYVNRWTGKNFGDLSLPERLSFIKLRNFMNENKQNIFGFDDNTLLNKYQSFLDDLNKQASQKGQGKGGGFSGKNFFTGGNIKGNMRDVITDYMYSKGTKFLVGQAINQTTPGSEESFEEMKIDFKNYLQKEFGLNEGQSELISKVLPQNVGDLVGMVPGRVAPRMGDVIKFPGKGKQEEKKQFKDPLKQQLEAEYEKLKGNFKTEEPITKLPGIPESNRTAEFYDKRKKGPNKKEIDNWVKDILSMPYSARRQRAESAKQLLLSTQPGENENYRYAKKLLDDNELFVAVDKDYVFDDFQKKPFKYDDLRERPKKTFADYMRPDYYEERKPSALEKSAEAWKEKPKRKQNKQTQQAKGIKGAYNKLDEYLLDKPEDKNTAKWLNKARTEEQNEPYIGMDYHRPIAFSSKEKLKSNPIQPIPVKLENIGDLKGVLGKGVLTGESDPFAWMDTKYNITKQLLAREKNKPLQIYTRSDLVSNDDYIAILDKKNHKINIVINGDNDRFTRLLEPGAPSLKRRLAAANKLKELGYDVKLISNSYKNPNINYELDKILNPTSLQLRKNLKDYGLRDDVKIETIETDISDEGVQNIMKTLGLKEE